jgi:hypothetical protein
MASWWKNANRTLIALLACNHCESDAIFDA